MKKLKQIFLALITSSLLLVATATPVFAETSQWTGVCVAENIPGGENVATIQGLECLIANVFSIIITVIGLAGFVMFIWGSFTWLLSGGNPKGVENARNTMIFAVVGLVVALSGFIVLNLISSFTGINVASFVIPGTDDTEEIENTVGCGTVVVVDPSTTNTTCDCSGGDWQQIDASNWKCGP